MNIWHTLITRIDLVSRRETRRNSRSNGFDFTTYVGRESSESGLDI